MLRTTIGLLTASALVGLASPSVELTLADSPSKPQVVAKSQSTKKSRTSTKTKSATPRRSRQRLPRYFGQLELSQEQREKVLAIQQKFDEQVGELKRQIDQLEADRRKELHGVLKTAQKRKLKSLLPAGKS